MMSLPVAVSGSGCLKVIALTGLQGGSRRSTPVIKGSRCSDRRSEWNTLTPLLSSKPEKSEKRVDNTLLLILQCCLRTQIPNLYGWQFSEINWRRATWRNGGGNTSMSWSIAAECDYGPAEKNTACSPTFTWCQPITHHYRQVPHLILLHGHWVHMKTIVHLTDHS